MRFNKSQVAFCEARGDEATTSDVDEIEHYMAFRRKESGFFLAICMIEYARDLKIPESVLGGELFQKLQDHACNIAILSEVCIVFQDLLYSHSMWAIKGYRFFCQGHIYRTPKYNYHSPENREYFTGRSSGSGCNTH